MTVEFENWKLLLVDKKISNARDLITILEDDIRSGFPIVIVAKDIEQEALATLVVNKLRGALKIAAFKARGFGERKSQYLDDIASLTRVSERKLVFLWTKSERKFLDMPLKWCLPKIPRPLLATIAPKT